MNDELNVEAQVDDEVARLDRLPWAERVRALPVDLKKCDFLEFGLRWLSTRAVCKHFGSLDSLHHRLAKGKDLGSLERGILVLYDADVTERVTAMRGEVVAEVTAALARTRTEAELEPWLTANLGADDVVAAERVVAALEVGAELPTTTAPARLRDRVARVATAGRERFAAFWRHLNDVRRGAE